MLGGRWERWSISRKRYAHAKNGGALEWRDDAFRNLPQTQRRTLIEINIRQRLMDVFHRAGQRRNGRTGRNAFRRDSHSEGQKSRNSWNLTNFLEWVGGLLLKWFTRRKYSSRALQNPPILSTIMDMQISLAKLSQAHYKRVESRKNPLKLTQPQAKLRKTQFNPVKPSKPPPPKKNMVKLIRTESKLSENPLQPSQIQKNPLKVTQPQAKPSKTQ